MEPLGGVSINRLPLELLVDVFKVLSDSDKIVCTLVHKHWGTLIKDYWKGIKTDPDTLLYHAARVGSRCQLNLAKSVGATRYLDALEPAASGGRKDLMLLLVSWWKIYNASKLTDAILTSEELKPTPEFGILMKDWHVAIRNNDLNKILIVSTEGGHIECMKLAKMWGANDFTMAMVGATIGGHGKNWDLINHLKRWGGDWYINGKISLCNDLLARAATYNCITFMELVKKMGANDYDRALAHSANSGNTACLKLAKKWGARDYNRALKSAVKAGRTECMKILDGWNEFSVKVLGKLIEVAAVNGQVESLKLLKEWGASPKKIKPYGPYGRDLSYYIVYRTAEKGHIKCLEFLKEWGIADIGRILSGAASGGQIECIKLAIKWGATDYRRGLLYDASSNGHIECMKFLKEWGAINFELSPAAGGGRPKCMKLLKEWGANDFAEALRTTNNGDSTFDSPYEGVIECKRLLEKWKKNGVW